MVNRFLKIYRLKFSKAFNADKIKKIYEKEFYKFKLKKHEKKI